MATKIVRLEPHIQDQEYPQPYNVEVSHGDIIEFKAIDSDFTINIPNQDHFLTLVDGSSAPHPINETITSGSSKSYKVNYPSGNLIREYAVLCHQTGLYADRNGARPTIRIV